MIHLISGKPWETKAKLSARIRRIKGQCEAIERADDKGRLKAPFVPLMSGTRFAAPRPPSPHVLDGRDETLRYGVPGDGAAGIVETGFTPFPIAAWSWRKMVRGCAKYSVV